MPRMTRKEILSRCSLATALNEYLQQQIQRRQKDSDWLAPSAGADVKGDMDITVYNDNISLGCRVKELAQWDKSQSGTNA